jgi:DNA-binding Lrp family transcriptional regulator
VITAFVLLDVDVARVGEVAGLLTEIPGIREVYSVTGRYDLIAKVVVARNEDLADVVTGRVGAIEGIESSETVIAFRSYSPRLLDEGFALGE